MSEPLVRVVRGQCKAARDRGSKWLLYSSLWYSIVHPKSTSPTAAAAAHSTVRENRAGGTSVGRSKKAPLMDGRGTYSTGHLSPRTPRDQSYCTVPTERVLGQSAATPVWVCVCGTGTAVLVRICPNPHNTPLSCSNSRAC
jgi:hypothetical protein